MWPAIFPKSRAVRLFLIRNHRSRIKPIRIKLSRADPNRIERNRTEPNRAEPVIQMQTVVATYLNWTQESDVGPNHVIRI